MKINSYLLICLVAIINVSLNANIKRTALQDETFSGALFSVNFILCFIIGICSLLLLLAVYQSGVNLARGILLMGAISILGGTIFGVLVKQNKLDTIEWVIFFTIAALYAYKLLKELLKV